MSARPGKRSVALVSLLALTCCTSSTVELAPTPHGAADRHAVVAAPRAATTVLDAEPGADSAIATAAALFRAAPLVLVPTDDRTTATAAALAPRLGAPVLPVPPDGPHRTEWRREIDRLSPEALLAVGAEAADAVRAGFPDLPVHTVERATSALPAGVPRVTPPRPVDVTLLVDADRDDAAAVATAKAAGATIVVTGADPRADPKAITALHAHPPRTVVALGGEFGPVERLRDRVAVATRGAQLVGGGQLVLPGRRIVCLYGHPGTPSLGVLGEQGAAASVTRAKRIAAAYQPLSDEPVVPAFEIIATVAQGAPGPDGDFSGESSVGELLPWVDAAGKSGLYVLLDLQPGRADLLTQARRYESLLRLPHVGLAVDPEWKLGPGQRPLGQIGGVDAAELNRTSAWLAGLARQYALPQKLFVVHQFRLTMIRDEAALDTSHDELSVLIHMDGQGSTAQKDSTWHSVVTARPGELPLGWKNFYDEDHPMLTPRQTMARRPTPAMISYQ